MKSIIFQFSLLLTVLAMSCGNEYPLTGTTPGDTPGDAVSNPADTFVWKGEKTLPLSQTIPAGATYWCAPGTQLLLQDNATLTVKGSLVLSGTADSPVRIFCPATATISIRGKMKAAHFISNGSGGTLLTGAGGSCILNDIELNGFANAINGYFSSLTIRNATFTENGVAVGLAQIGDFYSSGVRLSDLTLSGVRITGGGRQTATGLSINGVVGYNGKVLVQQTLFNNLKSAVTYAISDNATLFTAVNVTVDNCIDGVAPLAAPSPGFDTIIVSNSDISTRNPAVSLTASQSVDLVIVENSNVRSKIAPPMNIARDAATLLQINQAALLDKNDKAYSVSQVYESVADSAHVGMLVLDTAAVALRGIGYDFSDVDSTFDTTDTAVAALPAIPASIGAVAGNGSVTVSWSPSARAVTYNLYYAAGDSIDKSGARIAVATSPKTITGLANGTKYAFAVSAVNNRGESGLSMQKSVTPLTKPSAPAIASVVASDGAVTVAWNAVPMADSYNLYFRKGSDVDTSSAKFTGASSPKTVSGLTNGVLYAFAVTAVNSADESDLSPVDSAIPMGALAAPVLSVAAVADGSITLSWGAVSGATTYNVYYAAGATATKNDARIAEATSPKTISGLVNGTQYAFTVSAAGGLVESPLSAISTGTPQASPVAPAPPAGITATAGNGSVMVAWNAVAGATSYKLYYAAGTTVDKAGGAAFADASSPKNVPGLSNGMVYAFAVCAVNSAGESNLSTMTTATPVSAPGVPVIISVIPDDSMVTVSWSAVALATSYNLYYATGSTVDKTGLKLTAVASPYTIRALTNGTTYAFGAAAANQGGESGLSGVRTITPGVPPPPAPAGVTVEADDGAVTVAWNPVSGAVSYNIYYTQGATVDKTGTKSAGATSPKTIGELENGVMWGFCVTAVNAGGESAISDVATATPAAK